MAHVAKYQAPALGNMTAHYERVLERERGYVRSNIDPERTRLNYNLAPDRGVPPVEFIQERINSLELKRAPRKDAVRMCDCVLTLPESFDPARSAEFFAAGYGFLAARYGEENVVSAYVHMDEATPHMHFAWVPVTKDGRLSAKDVVNREDLRSLHSDMQADMERALGCPCEVLLDPEKQGEKQLSQLSQSEYIEAKERLECLRREEERAVQEIRAMEPAAQSVAESVRTLYEARSDAGREEVLAGEIEGLRERVSELERANSRAREHLAAIEERMRGLRDRFAQSRERFGQALEAVKERLLGRGEVLDNGLSRETKELARKLGIPCLDRFEMQMRHAQEASRALNATRRRPTRSRHQDMGLEL